MTIRKLAASLLAAALLLLPCGCNRGGGGGSTTQNIGGVRYTPAPPSNRRVNANAQLKKQQESRAKQEAIVRQLNGEEDESPVPSKKKDNGLFSN